MSGGTQKPGSGGKSKTSATKPVKPVQTASAQKPKGKRA